MAEPARNVPLTAEDVKLLRERDWCFHPEHGVGWYQEAAGCAALFEKQGWRFLARPADPNDPEGWVAHERGPRWPEHMRGMLVETETYNGIRRKPMTAENVGWHNMVRWRPHTPAPAGERSPSDVTGAALSRDIEALECAMVAPDAGDTTCRDSMTVDDLLACARANALRMHPLSNLRDLLEQMSSALSASQARAARASVALGDAAGYLEACAATFDKRQPQDAEARKMRAGLIREWVGRTRAAIDSFEEVAA